MSAHTNNGTSRPFRPFRLTLANASDTANAIVLSFIKPVIEVNVQHLHQDTFISRKSVFLSSESQNLLRPYLNFSVKIQTLGAEQLQYGLLVSSGVDGRYELLDGCEDSTFLQSFDDKMEDIMNLDSFSTENSLILLLTTEEYIESWLKETHEPSTIVVPRESFSMKPPGEPVLISDISSTKRYTLSPQNEKNPLDFIYSRYFNTLYSLTTPLSYFPKTALSRLKNMCSNEPDQILECLSKVNLSSDDLNRRRDARYGLFNRSENTPVNSVNSGKFEIENQDQFVIKYHSELLKENLADGLVLALKIREAQLQIIAVLEILICLNVDEEKFLNPQSIAKTKAPKKSSKPSLIRRKKKTVIPTFLGVGVSDEAESIIEVSANAHTTPSSLYLSLTTLIDQIALWDSLVETGKTDKDQNTLGFLSFVIVPYYAKTLPQIVSAIVKLFKEHRPNISRPRLMKSGRKSSESSLSLNDGNVETQSADTEVLPLYSEWTKSLSAFENAPKIKEKGVSKNSRFSKTLMSPDKIPFLKRAATSIDSASDEPAFSLKRSKSNLGTKNFKNRQVDMSVVKMDQAEAEAKRQTSFLFGDARKTKSSNSLGQDSYTNSSNLQVMATPAKSLKVIKSQSVLENGDRNINQNSGHTATQVFATPSHKRTLDLNDIVKATPQVPQKTTSIHEKLANAAKLVPEFGSVISSSPVQDFQGRDVFLNEQYELRNISSPIKAITSSPAEFKSKPGQPISLMQSPFFNNSLAGSPPPAKVSVTRTSPIVKKKRIGKAGNVKSIEPAKSVKSAQSAEFMQSIKPVKPKPSAKSTKSGSNTTTTAKVDKKSVAAKPKTLKKDIESAAPEKSIWDIFELENDMPYNTGKDILGSRIVTTDKPMSIIGDTERNEIQTKVMSNDVSEKRKDSTKTSTKSFKDAGSDSDSDYERLLAAVPKPAPKKYIKKRAK